MSEKNYIDDKQYLNLKTKQIHRQQKAETNYQQHKKIIFIIIGLLFILSFIFQNNIKNIFDSESNHKKIFFFDKYEVDIYNKIKLKLH